MGYSLSPNDIQVQASRILLTAASNELAKSTKELNDFIASGGDINSDAFKLIQSKVLSAQEAYLTASTSAYDAVKSSVFSSAYSGLQLAEDEKQKFEFKRQIENLENQVKFHKEDLALLDPNGTAYKEKMKKIEQLESDIAKNKANVKILEAKISSGNFTDGLIADIQSIKNCDDLKDWVEDKFEPLFKGKASSILKRIEPVKPWLDTAISLYEFATSLDVKNIGGILSAVVNLAAINFQPLKPYYYMYKNAAEALNDLTNDMNAVLNALESKKNELKCGFDIPTPSIPTLPNLPNLPV